MLSPIPCLLLRVLFVLFHSFVDEALISLWNFNQNQMLRYLCNFKCSEIYFHNQVASCYGDRYLKIHAGKLKKNKISVNCDTVFK